MFGGAAPDALDDLEMSAVKAVEVAEREHGMHKPRRARVVWKMQDLHESYWYVVPKSGLAAPLSRPEKSWSKGCRK